MRDGIAGDRRIGIEYVGLTRRHVRGHIGLQLIRQNLHFGLAVSLALFGGRVDFLFLRGARLHRNLQAAQVGSIDLVRIALFHHPRGTGLEHAHEIDGFHTLGRDGERRNADIILGADRRNDRIEVRRLRYGLKTEHIGERLCDIDIETDRGLAVLRKEFGRSVRRVHADGELAVLGD